MDPDFQQAFNQKFNDLRTKSDFGVEAKVCKRLLAGCKATDLSVPSDERLTLDWFYRTAAFPIRLCVQKIPWVFQTDWGDLFTRFHATKLVEVFDTWYAECSTDGLKATCGVVTPWPHRGFLVIHNYFHTPRANYTQIIRPTRLGTLIFEELDSLAEAVDWS